jgi:subtilisin family serine protease
MREPFERPAARRRALPAVVAWPLPLLVIFSLMTVACGNVPPKVLPGAAEWHLTAMQVDSTRTAGLGQGEVIALIDTGLSPAFLPKVAARVVNPWNAITETALVLDDNGHGTEVAVIAGGSGDSEVWGLAPGARLMPIKVADARGNASPQAVAAGIRWAVSHRATVVNLSLATLVTNDDLSATILAAMRAGIVVVASAGDAGIAGAEFPASVPGVIAVYGQDHNGRIAPDSNLPDGMGVLAPGIDIAALSVDGSGARRNHLNGTSAAAAIISGVIADCRSSLLAAGYPGLGVNLECETRVEHSGEPYGFLNVNQVLEVNR